MSQDDFARALREAGVETASKRLVQRWESGAIKIPRPEYRRALETVTGRPPESLGFGFPAFVAVDKGDGQDGEYLVPVRPVGATGQEMYSGIWLSKYTYFSSGRDAELTGLHYVVVVQYGSRLTVQSLPNGSSNPNSPLTMNLEIDKHALTGTWTEQTAKDGYYRGAVYHGAIQILAEPTGRRMSGMWVGFGKDFEVNTGPWELVFQTADTSNASLAEYNKPPKMA